MGAAILDNDVFRACHRYCLTIGPLRKAGSLTSLNDWSVEQTSCLTALNHWSVEERIPTRMGSCLGASRHCAAYLLLAFSKSVFVNCLKISRLSCFGYFQTNGIFNKAVYMYKKVRMVYSIY